MKLVRGKNLCNSCNLRFKILPMQLAFKKIFSGHYDYKINFEQLLSEIICANLCLFVSKLWFNYKNKFG